nr:MAG TPA: zinc-ribbon domain protein [Caudoviricetes sp.]
MNIKCPNCGAVHSLDTLINDAEASAVLKAVLEMDAELGKAAIRYIGLFRPAKSQLSWARTAKLLNELLPMIKAQEAARDGVCFPAPTEAWIHSFNETVNARDQGRLKLPLKSHGYLLEIVSQWQGSGLPSPQPSPTGRGGEGGAPSKLRQGVAALGEWAGNDWAKREIAAGFALLAALNLPNRPAAQDLPVVAEIWYQQLKEAKEIVSPEYDPIRIQTGFKVLQAAETWPQPAELRRNLPPRLIPRAMLAKPAPDKEKGRQKMAEVKDVLNKKGK